MEHHILSELKLFEHDEKAKANFLSLVEDSNARRSRCLDEFGFEGYDQAPQAVLLPPRKRPPIFRPSLPTEIIILILDYLDFKALRSFSLANSACLSMVKTMRRYQNLLDEVPHFFKTIHQIELETEIASYEDFLGVMMAGECIGCKSFAPFIFTGENSTGNHIRVCFRCLRTGGSYYKLDGIDSWKLIDKLFEPVLIERVSIAIRKQFKLQNAIFAPVYNNERNFWDYGLDCIGCSELQDLVLIGGGLEELLIHIATCDRAVTKLWCENQELLDSISAYYG